MEKLVVQSGFRDGKPYYTLANRDGSWIDNNQEALRKLAAFEAAEEAGLIPPADGEVTSE